MATDDVKQMFRQWYNVLPQISKEFAKDKKIEESKIVSTVSKKAVETAYNYYGVEAQKVSEKALLMTGLLVFYVIYTMWWGFAIFYIFDGIGLTMSKSKVKKEV
jgi:predicted Zn-dependent peptidase